MGAIALMACLRRINLRLFHIFLIASELCLGDSSSFSINRFRFDFTCCLTWVRSSFHPPLRIDARTARTFSAFWIHENVPIFFSRRLCCRCDQRPARNFFDSSFDTPNDVHLVFHPCLASNAMTINGLSRKIGC